MLSRRQLQALFGSGLSKTALSPKKKCDTPNNDAQKENGIHDEHTNHVTLECLWILVPPDYPSFKRVSGGAVNFALRPRLTIRPESEKAEEQKQSPHEFRLGMFIHHFSLKDTTPDAAIHPFPRGSAR